MCLTISRLIQYFNKCNNREVKSKVIKDTKDKFKYILRDRPSNI